jgi:hypothetical protein
VSATLGEGNDVIHFNGSLGTAVCAPVVEFLKHCRPLAFGQGVLNLGELSTSATDMGATVFLATFRFLVVFIVFLASPLVSRFCPPPVSSTAIFTPFKMPILVKLPATIYAKTRLYFRVTLSVRVMTVAAGTHLFLETTCVARIHSATNYAGADILPFVFQSGIASFLKSAIASTTHLANKSTILAIFSATVNAWTLVLSSGLELSTIAVEFLITGYAAFSDVLLILKLAAIYAGASIFQSNLPLHIEPAQLYHKLGVMANGTS